MTGRSRFFNKNLFGHKNTLPIKEKYPMYQKRWRIIIIKLIEVQKPKKGLDFKESCVQVMDLEKNKESHNSQNSLFVSTSVLEATIATKRKRTSIVTEKGQNLTGKISNESVVNYERNKSVNVAAGQTPTYWKSLPKSKVNIWF